jgi:hypothetical protein
MDCDDSYWFVVRPFRALRHLWTSVVKWQSWWNGVADFWTTTIGHFWRNARHSGPIDRNSVFTWWIFGLPRHPLLTTLLWTCVWFVSSLNSINRMWLWCLFCALFCFEFAVPFSCFVHYSVLNFAVPLEDGIQDLFIMPICALFF